MFQRVVLAAERIAYKASGTWAFLDRGNYCGRDDLVRINRERFSVVCLSRAAVPYNRIIRTFDGTHYLALVLRIPERAVPVLLNLSAAAYMMIGATGWHLQMNQEMMSSVTERQSAVSAIAVFLLINGICFFGDLRDRVRIASEMIVRKRREMFGRR